MRTADCKTFIAKILGNPRNKVIHDELILHHEATDYKEGFWSRALKRKIRTQDDLEDIEWVVDSIKDAATYGPSDYVWFDSAYGSGNFKNCVMRLFVHREVEGMFGIITDPADSTVVCWAFSID